MTHWTNPGPPGEDAPTRAGCSLLLLALAASVTLLVLLVWWLLP